MLERPSLKDRAAAHWFFLALPVLLAFSALFARSTEWGEFGRGSEAALLFDWCVTVPVLYGFCYRKSLSPRVLAIRMLALSCLGVWVASQLVPAGAQTILPHLSWPRTLGLVVLALIELRLLVAVLRIAFSGKGTVDDVVEVSGAPPLVARLMLMEARFWRAVWRRISGR